MTAVPVFEGADPVEGKVVQAVEVGVLHRNDRFPHLYGQNFLSVDPTRHLSAEVLIAEADRLLADLPIRHVLVTDAQAAARLRAGFLEAGYREEVLVTMLLRRPPDREPRAAHLVELGAMELAPTIDAHVRAGPLDGNVGREVSRLREEMGRHGVRFLAVLVEGEPAGWCELRRNEAGGQVEDVVVLEPFRGRGLARALVGGAIARLREDGCGPIFVVADDTDTVKDLYRRLGFDDVRRTWGFLWSGPG